MTQIHYRLKKNLLLNFFSNTYSNFSELQYESDIVLIYSDEKMYTHFIFSISKHNIKTYDKHKIIKHCRNLKQLCIIENTSSQTK